MRAPAPALGDRTSRIPDPITVLGCGTLDDGRFHPRVVPDGAETDPSVSRAVARAKQGDRAALGYLYSRYADCVFGFVASILHDERDAEDATQHVFVKLMTKLDRYEERESPFVAWLLRVARNVALDHLRQRRDLPCAEVLDPDADVDDAHLQRGLLIREALARIPQAQREVVVLRHVVGLTPVEIAGRLGRSEASIHGLHHRGRGAIRGELEVLDARPVTCAAA